MKAKFKIPVNIILLPAFICLFTVTAFSQNGTWQRSGVKENMTNLKEQKARCLPNCTFSGKSDDMGMTYEFNYYSNIDRKSHVYRGHVAWTWKNPGTMVPGEKITIRGVISNLSAESGGVTAYATLGNWGFMKPESGKSGDESAKPNGSAVMAGTFEVPKVGYKPDGTIIPYLNLTFILSGGNEQKFIERTIVYKWVPSEKTPPVMTGGINGVFKTDFNEMTLQMTGNKVTGTYKWNDGRIEGTLNGLTLTGWWYQSNGKGRFVFQFSPGFKSFTGKWGYNNEEPSRVWNGEKISN